MAYIGARARPRRPDSPRLTTIQVPRPYHFVRRALVAVYGAVDRLSCGACHRATRACVRARFSDHLNAYSDEHGAGDVATRGAVSLRRESSEDKGLGGGGGGGGGAGGGNVCGRRPSGRLERSASGNRMTPWRSPTRARGGPCDGQRRRVAHSDGWLT